MTDGIGAEIGGIWAEILGAMVLEEWTKHDKNDSERPATRHLNLKRGLGTGTVGLTPKVGKNFSKS